MYVIVIYNQWIDQLIKDDQKKYSDTHSWHLLLTLKIKFSLASRNLQTLNLKRQNLLI